VVVVMLDPHAGPRLRGRHQEREALDRHLAEVRAGRSQVLVVRGEAGVGKTVLLDYLEGRASACRVARAAGVESEMELAFAGLHQLCAPMLDGLAGLPDPQRDALDTALGLGAGRAPDRFLVGLAVLGLLSEVSADRPLVCLIDDAQWLDRASVQVLAFAARRLLAEPVAVVFVVREPSDEHDLVGLPELVVRGLRDADARALLDSLTPGGLDPRVRDRIVAETQGNPLALLELPLASTPGSWPGGSAVPTRRRWRAASSRASCGSSSPCRARRNGSCSRRPPNRSATCRCCGKQRNGSGSASMRRCPPRLRD
jgi:hypothetical protein